MSHPIPRRQLGHGLQVSALGLGCMGMSDFYGPSDHASNLAVLNHAIDMGMNFLDTADMYGVGRNEQLLAEVLATASQAVAERFEHLPGQVRKACPDLPPVAIERVLAVIASARNEWVRQTAELVTARVLDDDEPDEAPEPEAEP